MRRSNFPADLSAGSRDGSVLILVLVIVSALSLAVFTFSEQTLNEYAATRVAVEQVQARSAAVSGLESVRAHFESSVSRTPQTSRRSRTAVGPPTSGKIGDRDRETNYQIVRLPLETAVNASFSPGLVNASSRFDPNSLSLKPSRLRESRERLLALPGMTPDLAASLLSWMSVPEGTPRHPEPDHDDPPRRRIERLDELLDLPGMSLAILYGEDRNGNGLRDPDEPDSNRDSRLQRGLSEFLTVEGCEATSSPLGPPKIDINRRDLAGLYDALRGRFSPEVARFLVACRISPIEYEREAADRTSAEQERLERLDSARRRLERQLGGSTVDEPAVDPKDLVRAGMSLPTSPPFRIESLTDLAGARVRVRVADQDTLLASPWGDDARGFETLLRDLEPVLTVVSGPCQRGRINLQEAPLPVLLTVPGLGESLARTIVARRRPDHPDQSTIAWILREGLVTPIELRRVGPYLTTGGSVWEGISIGRTAGSKWAAGLRFVLAETSTGTTLLRHDDLPSFTWDQGPSAGDHR